MSLETFDYLKYFEDLKDAGMPEQQARLQATALRDFSNLQEEKNRSELATKADIQHVRLEMKAMEIRLLKWQIGLAAAISPSWPKASAGWDFEWLAVLFFHIS